MRRAYVPVYVFGTHRLAKPIEIRRNHRPEDCLFVVIVEHIATPGEHERGRCHHRRCAPVYSAEQEC